MTEPKAGSITHVRCLVTGDRFYCCSDEKKIVWEVRFHTDVKVRGAIKRLSQCRNDAGQVHRFDANRTVVFLRRTRPLRKKNREFSIDRYFA